MKYHIDCLNRDEITGWVFGDFGPSTIEILINDRRMEWQIERIMRPDVRLAFPDSTYSEHSGFRIILPVVSIADDPVCRVVIAFSSGDDVARVEAEVPSATSFDPAAREFSSVPFPPAIMATIAATSTENWRDIIAWEEDDIAHAVDVLLFLLRSGSRRGEELFAYFSFLSRIARAFEFNERNFPAANQSTGKDRVAIASSGMEHFMIAHHLMTLKAHGIRGDFLEFGCFKGFSTSCLSVACALLGIPMRVLDSFEGLPPSASSYYATGEFAGGLDEVARNVRNFGAIDVVTFHKGFFADTLPNLNIGPVMCVWMDVDLELSARDAATILPKLDRRSCVFSHECLPEFFRRDGSITIERQPEAVLPPIYDAFIADRREPAGRYLVHNTGVIWDKMNSIPPGATSMLKLYNAILGR
jgi:O-methyltransferase